MEPTRPPQSSQSSNEDVDLGRLFTSAGGVINRFFSAIGSFFRGLGKAAIFVLFFLRRNLLWLVLGTVIGMAYGIYSLSKNGSKYSSTMTIRTNFSSSRSLYQTIESLNAFINSGRTSDLGHMFNITPGEAKSLVYFEANPEKSELITADMYKDQFLKGESNGQRLDTFWMNAVKYPDFKNSLTKYDFPIHQVTLTATDEMIFSKIQEGLIREISSNALLQNLRTSNQETNREAVGLLKSSIEGLDTLRAAYNKRLNSGETAAAANNVNFLGPAQNQSHTPELDLYDKMLQIKNELKLARNQEVVENNIVQVYASFGPFGQKISFIRQSIVTNGITGFVTVLLIITLISMHRYLKKLEKSWAIEQPASDK